MNKNISLVTPVLNESWSLIQVVDIIMEDNHDTVLEIILAIHPERTLPKSLDAINHLVKKYGDIIKPVYQKLPFVGGAIRDAFNAAQGDFYLLFGSDLETDPYLIKTMIQKAHADEADIITASRWLKGGSFGKYHPFKKICNKVFQSFFSSLYGVKLTDMTYGFRIFKKEIINSIEWNELRHPIFLELILKPIKLGYKVIEIPAQWEPRQEGESQIKITDYIGYISLGLKLRFKDLNQK